MTIRKRRQPTPGFRLPPPYEPFTGERAPVQVPGIFPYCAMMQIAAEDTECEYVICRGYDPRNGRYYEYVEAVEADPEAEPPVEAVEGKPGIAVAKPYGKRHPGVYHVGEVYPAILPLSSGAEDDGKIVPRIGQNPGRVEGALCKGQPRDLTEEIILLQDDDGNYINWFLLDGGRELVMFELLQELVQWNGPNVVNAARKTWDPSANEGKGGYTVDCDDVVLVADFNEVGHTAGDGGFGVAVMQRREDGTPVGTIIDLCCPTEEQGGCGA